MTYHLKVRLGSHEAETAHGGSVRVGANAEAVLLGFGPKSGDGAVVTLPPDLALRLAASIQQAARASIGAGALWDRSPDWRGGVDEAADIARGTVR